VCGACTDFGSPCATCDPEGCSTTIAGSFFIDSEGTAKGVARHGLEVASVVLLAMRKGPVWC
jgi:hypothetical protein